MATTQIHSDEAAVGASNPLPANIYGYDGSAVARLRTGAAGVLSGTTQPLSLLVTRPGDWSVTHAPAANTVATASKAAGAAGVRHVCTSVSATIAGGAVAPTATTVTLQLRDGATGAGSVVGSWTIGIEATAGRTVSLVLTGLNIVGSAATAMTLEFSAAGGLNTLESVTLSGYSV